MSKLVYFTILLCGSFIFLQSNIISCHRIQKRIVGGHNAADMHDTIVKLRILDSPSFLPFWVYYQTSMCTGTFITHGTILTAAHCFSDLKTQKHKIDITTTNGDRSIRLNINTIIIHPEYSPDDLKSSYNDLAIVVLSERLDWVQPIEIKTFIVDCRSELSLYGFGQKSGSFLEKIFSGRPELHVMKSKYIECNHPTIMITQVDGKTICDGDSGGAVISSDGLLAGVILGVKWQAGWDRCPKGNKNMVVRLSKFISFVREYAPNAKIIYG